MKFETCASRKDYISKLFYNALENKLTIHIVQDSESEQWLVSVLEDITQFKAMPYHSNAEFTVGNIERYHCTFDGENYHHTLDRGDSIIHIIYIQEFKKAE